MSQYKKPNRIFYKTNWQIRHPEVRLVDEKNKQVGVFTIEEARRLANEQNLDLVEIAPLARPPVVKLIEFSKFKYLENKKKRNETKTQKGGELKEIRMTPFIGPGDFDTRVKRAKEFLGAGNKIKIGIKFKGRQNTKKEFGYGLLERFIDKVGEIGQKEGDIKSIGSMLFLTLTPVKKKRKNDETKIEN